MLIKIDFSLNNIKIYFHILVCSLKILSLSFRYEIALKKFIIHNNHISNSNIMVSNKTYLYIY